MRRNAVFGLLILMATFSSICAADDTLSTCIAKADNAMSQMESDLGYPLRDTLTFEQAMEVLGQSKVFSEEYPQTPEVEQRRIGCCLIVRGSRAGFYCPCPDWASD